MLWMSCLIAETIRLIGGMAIQGRMADYRKFTLFARVMLVLKNYSIHHGVEHAYFCLVVDAHYNAMKCRCNAAH